MATMITVERQRGYVTFAEQEKQERETQITGNKKAANLGKLQLF